MPIVCKHCYALWCVVKCVWQRDFVVNYYGFHLGLCNNLLNKKKNKKLSLYAVIMLWTMDINYAKESSLKVFKHVRSTVSA